MDSKFKSKFLVRKFNFNVSKEVADRIVAKFNTSNYGRLSIISNWKLYIKNM